MQLCDVQYVSDLPAESSTAHVKFCTAKWNETVRLLSSHQGEPGSIPGRFTPNFRKWESWRSMPLVGGFSRVSPVFFPPLHSALLNTHLTSPHRALQDLDSIAVMRVKTSRVHQPSIVSFSNFYIRFVTLGASSDGLLRILVHPSLSHHVTSSFTYTAMSCRYDTFDNHSRSSPTRVANSASQARGRLRCVVAPPPPFFSRGGTILLHTFGRSAMDPPPTPRGRICKFRRGAFFAIFSAWKAHFSTDFLGIWGRVVFPYPALLRWEFEALSIKLATAGRMCKKASKHVRAFLDEFRSDYLLHRQWLSRLIPRTRLLRRNGRAGVNGRSPRKHADQRDRLARFPYAKIRELPPPPLQGKRTRFALGGRRVVSLNTINTIKSDYSRLTWVNWVRFEAGSLPHSRTRETCRTMQLVGGFSRGSPVSLALAFRRCSILTSLHLHRLSRHQFDVKIQNYFSSIVTNFTGRMSLSAPRCVDMSTLADRTRVRGLRNELLVRGRHAYRLTHAYGHARQAADEPPSLMMEVRPPPVATQNACSACFTPADIACRL
ncbi:hypothetical protein PR048_024752 [Dryococelus australis]|uniref:Uncharacterized protein n=1 Tax=Dryococelus australis TaxID=614101 RepID=A0ABQ9GPF3_9NEOP|nr:hypothetical protein PR048_024752 [Dryococelus australis]